MENSEAYKSLVEMGISPVMAEASILKTKSNDISALLDWIGDHSNEEVQLGEWIQTQKNAPKPEEGAAQQGQSISHLVNMDLNAQLQSLGHSKNVSEKSLFLTGNNDINKALKWIEDHKYDMDFEQQLKIVGKQESTLTEEEAKQRLEELQKKIRQNRKKKEEEDALEREKNRMKSGKELVEAKRLAEEAQARRQVELDKIEKARDEDYKRKLLIQMKRERCEKLGIPFDESKALVEETSAPKVELSKTERVMVQIEQVKVGNFAYPDKAKTFFDTTVIYLNNIIKNPTEAKFRRINTSNNAYQNRIAGAFGGPEVLRAIGFQPEDTFLVLEHPDIEELKQIVKVLERESSYL